jgi:hypothetical protein
MKSKNIGAIALIFIGIAFLLRNLNLVPRLGVLWPVVFIALGLVALYQAGNGQRRDSQSSGEVLVEVDRDSPFFKALIAIPAVLIALIVGLIVLGVVGPIFLLVLLFIPFILFIKLGWVFLRLLIPIVLAASPILLLILVLALIF